MSLPPPPKGKTTLTDLNGNKPKEGSEVEDANPVYIDIEDDADRSDIPQTVRPLSSFTKSGPTE